MLRVKAKYYAMKKIFILALLFLGCTTLQLSENPDFYLEITYDKMESSQDSNSQSEGVTIADDIARYGWSYSGYHPDSDFETYRSDTIRLSEEQILELMELIEKENLWEEVNEDQVTNELGGAVSLTLTMHEGDRSVTSSIEGMAWSLETQEGNIENLEYIDSARRVIYFIEDMLND